MTNFMDLKDKKFYRISKTAIFTIAIITIVITNFVVIISFCCFRRSSGCRGL